VIRSFGDGDTEKVWNLTFVKGISKEIQQKARTKMQILDAAEKLEDTNVPPGNRLEKLTAKGGREGQFSIRVNDQYRICFKWDNGNADDVELVDYH
jgi:proteic killer suppression protein